jgi:hypothetical protein
MPVPLFIGIPCYRESESLKRTVAALTRNTRVAHILDVQVAKQSVVLNKNELLKRARQAGADYVSFCDDDVEPELGWEEKLIHGIEEVHQRTRHRVGQSSPRFVYPDGSLFCTWVNIYLSPVGDDHYMFLPGAVEVDAELYHTSAFVGALPGTCTIFTADFLEKVGWSFDTRYETSQFEDIDQSLTCRDLGFKLLYNGHVRVVHHYPKSNPRTIGGNWGRLVEKWGRRTDLTSVIPGTAEALAQVAPFPSQKVLTVRPGIFRTIWGALKQHPFQRVWTAARVFGKNGLPGVRAHLTRIRLEQGLTVPQVAATPLETNAPQD